MNEEKNEKTTVTDVWKSCFTCKQTTNEEALEGFKTSILASLIDGRIMIGEKKTAMKALEKQIPMKVKKEHIETNMCAFTLDVCANCETSFGGRVSAKDYKWCPYCGQAIDWSDKDEN